MKRLLIIFLAAFFALGAGQNPRLAYIEKYSALAVKEMERTGIPASITLAQGILESDSGQSLLAEKGNNHFGIKCHNDWAGKKMHYDDDALGECFRVYPSVEHSYKDHSDFLRGRDRYKDLFELETTDYKSWARGLKKAGYATDPAYANKLIKLIEDYNLQRFDLPGANTGQKSRNSKTRVRVKTPREIETPVKMEHSELEKGYNELVNLSFGREVYKQNGVPFIYALEGESYSSIAESNGLFLKELLRYNDLESEESLTPGNVVYLGLKKSKAAQGATRYVVDAEGETLYGIAQRFGIRLKALRRLNPLLQDRQLEEGDTVMLGN